MEGNAMKRIILLALFALCATGCIKYETPNEWEKANELELGEEVEAPIMEIEHNGHNYLLFEGYGVIHDPNCCCKRVSEE